MTQGFGACNPGSTPSAVNILVLNDYAITIYLSSIKFNAKYHQGCWRTSHVYGFSAGDLGSNPSDDNVLVLNDYAITIYLSSIKFNSKYQQGCWRTSHV